MAHTIIIAEAGVNHNGSIDVAKKLIEAAVETGADYVKFQTFKAEKLVAPNAPKADYQIQNTKDKQETGQFEMLRKLELKDTDFKLLKSYADQKGIGFLSTPFDLESVDFLETLDLDYFKIGSGDLTNGPMLAKIAKLKRKVILSTGMADMTEIKAAVKLLNDNGLNSDQIIILQCNTEYPTPPEDVNLRAMITIGSELGTFVGYSDNALGAEYAVAAVAMGAEVIEKHLTLDKGMDGPDHAASADPQEFKAMVKMIRNVEKAMGSGIKQPSASERKNLDIARKSIHLARPVSGGSVLKEDDLEMKRPGTGISPMRTAEVIGRKTKRDLHKDQLLNIEDLE